MKKCVEYKITKFIIAAASNWTLPVSLCDTNEYWRSSAVGVGAMLPCASREQYHAANNDCIAQYTLSADKVPKINRMFMKFYNSVIC